MNPSLGRTVLFGGPAYPEVAVIAGVNQDGSVNIWVFPNSPFLNPYFVAAVEYTSDPAGKHQPGRWSWPARATFDVPERMPQRTIDSSLLLMIHRAVDDYMAANYPQRANPTANDTERDKPQDIGPRMRERIEWRKHAENAIELERATGEKAGEE